MSDKTKVQPPFAVEVYCCGKRIVKAIGNMTQGGDRPVSDVLAYGQSSPNALVPGIQTFELTLEIPNAPDPTLLRKQFMQAFLTETDLNDLFDTGGIFEAELPQEKWLDAVPIIILAAGLDSRVLEDGTPIDEAFVPFFTDVFLGATFRQLVTSIEMGESHVKTMITLRMLERRTFQGPVAIDSFNCDDKADESGVECSFQLTEIPTELIDGQFAVVMVDNELWRKGYYYDASSNLIIFDYAGGYCPECPVGMFLREEHDIAAALVTLENIPLDGSLKITNEYDTERYLRVAAAPAQGEYSYVGAAVTFNALDNGQTIHANYLHQGPNVPFKNITIVYVTERTDILAGTPLMPLKGSTGP